MWALKYRPKCLDEVLGQVWPKQLIYGALKKRKDDARGWLVSGPWGSGKTTITRILAKAISCLSPLPSGEACQHCISCLSIDNETSLNYTEIDAASAGGKDDIRELIQEAHSAPVGGSKAKTIALDEAHALSKPAQNTLLKTLEDIPPTTHIMLVTTDPDNLLQTIRSRCVPVELESVDRRSVVDHLVKICEIEQVEAEREALELIVNHKYGHVRDALTLTETIALAGAIKVSGVRRHLHLDLEEVVLSFLIHIGKDWSQTAVQLEVATKDYPPQEIWAAIRRVVVGAELFRLATSSSTNSEQMKILVDSFGGHLNTAAEWALDTGERLAVRTEVDVLVGMAILHEKLGGAVSTNTEQKVIRNGQPKRHQNNQAVHERHLAPDEAAKRLGFDAEERKQKQS